MKRHLLAISTAMALVGAAVPAMAQNVSGSLVLGFKPGTGCFLFQVVGGDARFFGIPNNPVNQLKATSVIDAWFHNQTVSFTVLDQTISCTIYGVSHPAYLIGDLAFGGFTQ